MFFINRNKEKSYRRKNWLKTVIYFIILNGLYLVIWFSPNHFYLISAVILVLGTGEIIRNFILSKKVIVGIVALVVLLLSAIPFLEYGQLDQNHLLFCFFLVAVFDAFSQLTGQLIGKVKFLPVVSPNKTLEGVLGGLLSTLITSVFIRNLIEVSFIQAIILGLGISFFSLLGDLLASLCKRKFQIKDYSNLIPGHGGVLDRFDSLIAAGSFMAVIFH
tara:strand:+ start:3716 stop:4369 length:654 start_codon:yes stop_codon:yes gene_type:complete